MPPRLHPHGLTLASYEQGPPFGMTTKGDIRDYQQSENMAFPDDVDGDVLRRLEQSGFDFSKEVLIDFNVDFESWPPPADAIALLSAEYPSTKVYGPEDGEQGCVHFQVYGRVSHDLVCTIQKYVAGLMAPFHGSCDSWGVLN